MTMGGWWHPLARSADFNRLKPNNNPHATIMNETPNSNSNPGSDGSDYCAS